jgi:hypothetical protein
MEGYFCVYSSLRDRHNFDACARANGIVDIFDMIRLAAMFGRGR